jgi:hypothetical protein
MTTSASSHDSVVVMYVQCSFGRGSTTASFDPTTLLVVRAVGSRVGHGALDGEMFQCVVLYIQRGQQA